MIRRASVDDRRRASLGGTTGSFRQEHAFDPHHTAILFRDSRGVSPLPFIIIT